MRFLRVFVLGAVPVLASAGSAFAATPSPATTAAPAATPPSTASCFASFYNYISASATECPLTYMGITLYGLVDVDLVNSEHRSRFNGYYTKGVSQFISKANNGGNAWQWGYNASNQTVIGIRGKEPLGSSGWSFVFDVAEFYDPYTFHPLNGPRSIVDNNNHIFSLSANSDSSLAGQWDNARAYAGISSDTYGTLTAGRVTSFSNDYVNTYDPMGGAFSLVSATAAYVQGAGATETARYNTGVKYLVNYQNFHAGTVWQLGGMDEGNGARSAFQFDGGATFGSLSLDAVYSHAVDAVTLTAYSSGAPALTDLRATLSNIDSGILFARYTIGQWRLFGGYEYSQFTNASDNYSSGFKSLGGFNVLGSAVTFNDFTHNKVQQVAWAGARYYITPDVDVGGAYYIVHQSAYGSNANYALGTSASCSQNFDASVSPTAGSSIDRHCAGTVQSVAATIDYRPFKRVDLYAGVTYSKASGGLSNGFIFNSNIAGTLGTRVTF